MSAALTHTTQRTRRSFSASVRELVLMGTVFMLYRQVRHLTSGDVDKAMSNADRVVDVEQRLGVFREGWLQHLVLRSRLAIEFLDHYYVFVHFTASVGFMVWVFVRHPHVWPRIRAWFLAVTLAGLAIHVAFPLAPPRMLGQHGFVDTLHVYGPSIYSRDVTASAANQLAAMPSLHFAWAALVAAGVVTVCTSRWRWLIVLHPIVTLLAIVATANHYWLDATVGGVLVVGSIVAAHHLGVSQLASHWSRNGRRSPSLVPPPAWADAFGPTADVVAARRQGAHGGHRGDRDPHPARRCPAVAERLVVGHRPCGAVRADRGSQGHLGRRPGVFVRRHDRLPCVDVGGHQR